MINLRTNTNCDFYSYLQNLSCNELTSLPSSIGELSTLRELNVHQNYLEQLPDGKYVFLIYLNRQCLFNFKKNL